MATDLWMVKIYHIKTVCNEKLAKYELSKVFWNLTDIQYIRKMTMSIIRIYHKIP